MNKTNLHLLFKKYIERFEEINNCEHHETYKWEIAQKFQSFDVNAEDFYSMLYNMHKISENLIDSSQQLPFYGLVKFAEKEPETVREMFRDLFSSEHLDPAQKQFAIDKFINSSEELRKKYHPGSRLYINNQRSVMTYLFLRYPDSNFAYKPRQAKSFADCIEFYDDWGPLTNFHLDIYSRMCEQVIEEIKKDKDLLTTHYSRYENAKQELYPDENLHILLFDIIYSSQTYGFYKGIVFDPINAKSRNLYFESVAKAKELAEKASVAKERERLLKEALEYIEKTITNGVSVCHKSFGIGTVESCNATTMTVYFEKIKDTKKIGLVTSFCNGILTFESDELTQKIGEYIPILKDERNIPNDVKKANDDLQPYLEYLDD